MIEIIDVRFRADGRAYSFDPGEFNPAAGSYVVVETARGVECGEVAAARHAVREEQIVKPLREVIREATEEDLKLLSENHKRQDQAFAICEKKIRQHNLEMKLIEASCAFDSNRITFFFTADGRVDFRELVRDLASTLHARIELRQVGVRDEAKMLGGFGICGQPFCCAQFLDDFQPVSIRMAKEQGLSLNPTKISGTCGRLMCCLKYEQDVYEELIKLTPRVGTTVRTAEGTGVISEVNLLSGKLKVRLDDGTSVQPITVHRDNVTVVRSAKARPKKDAAPPEPLNP